MLKAGEYYVGDLCYVMDQSWSDVCGVTIKENECLEGEFNLPDGRRFAMFGTKWGDGEYNDKDGNRFCVDSGTIGCVRVEDTDDPESTRREALGKIFNFDYDFEVSESDGVIKIGHIKIDTDPIYDEDNEDYDEEVFADWDKD